MHVLLFDPFTNEFDDTSLDDFFDKSLSFVLAVWPCQLFLGLGPRCRPVLGRHRSEQLTVLPGTDDRATHILGFLEPPTDCTPTLCGNYQNR